MSSKAKRTPPWVLPILGIGILSALTWQPLHAATFQGSAFQDLNNNGLMEACEPVLPNTTLFIRDNAEADAGRGGLFNRLTDENGQYLSISHNTGSHTLWSDIPTGWEQTAPERGQGTAFYDVNIANSSDTVTINFGLRDPSDPVRNCTICDTVTQIPTAQCQALIALYDNTGGDNWTNKAGWKQTNTPCTGWYNLACQNGQVTDIALENNNLVGTIPDISALTELETLVLGKNRGITGNFPDISQLSKRYHFSVGPSQISGTLPATLLNASQLRELGVTESELTGDLPDFSQLTHLTQLNLGHNQFTGEIPALPSGLTLLNLAGNDLCRHPNTDAGYNQVDAFPLCGNPNITLTSPADGATDISISGQVFTWEPDPVASAHRIVISTQADFANFTDSFAGGDGIYCNDTTACFTANIPSTEAQSYTALSLSENTTYYWKVRASRNPTFWSEVHSFTTGAAPKTGCNGDIQLPDNLCQDVVAYYSLDNHSNDLTGNGNNGVEQGSVNYLTGVKGQAANFDGIDDYIEIADSPNLHLGTDSFSMAMWLKANTFSGKYDNTSIRALTKNGYPASWWNVDISSTGSLEMEIKDAVSARSFSKLSTGTINTGEWAHITIVVDRQNAEVKHYINGVLDTTLPLPSFGEISVKGHPFEIGSGSFNPFNGLIDELYLHRRVLTDAEIQGLYDSTKPATTGCNGDTQLPNNLCDGLVAYYPLDENPNDASGNGNHGVVNGAT
ncbi:MAG TPA: hypothetical protein EYP59_14660, partial [Thiotrichaceae bacterium]|nr:hypothetical protein [Thiotrichaceae bacterium]